MTPSSPEHGFSLICTPQGQILGIARDGLGLSQADVPGTLFTDLVEPACVDKAHQLLHTVRTLHAAFGWELSVVVRGVSTPLVFAATLTQDKLVIVGCRTSEELARLHEELMKINNEQTNTLRATLKDLALLGREQCARDSQLYDDMTRLNNELANLQRELVRKNVELERLNEQKNHFLGMAAHDLRSPLGIILAYSEFLAAEASHVLSGEHCEFITTIRHTSEFLLGLINDLLDVSQIESGKLNLDLQPTNLSALVAHNVGMNRVLAEKKDIRIELSMAGELPEVQVDAGKIEQVLNNLLSNAVKFSHPGTSTTLRLYRDSDHVHLTVTDQGQGIPEEDLDKLFKPFGRTRVRSTRGEACTGLGLTIVRRIIEGHGGTVRVQSEVGTGTTFLVSFPIAARLRS